LPATSAATTTLSYANSTTTAAHETSAAHAAQHNETTHNQSSGHTTPKVHPADNAPDKSHGTTKKSGTSHQEKRETSRSTSNRTAQGRAGSERDVHEWPEPNLSANISDRAGGNATNGTMVFMKFQALPVVGRAATAARLLPTAGCALVAAIAVCAAVSAATKRAGWRSRLHRPSRACYSEVGIGDAAEPAGHADDQRELLLFSRYA